MVDLNMSVTNVSRIGDYLIVPKEVASNYKINITELCTNLHSVNHANLVYALAGLCIVLCTTAPLIWMFKDDTEKVNIRNTLTLISYGILLIVLTLVIRTLVSY